MMQSSQQENIMPLYLITSPTGKQYVGITTRSVNRRMTGHKTAARLGSPYPLHAAIRKYGFESMRVETLHPSRDIEELRALEVSAVAERNTFAPFGYNLTAGGEGTTGHIVSDEHRAAIAARLCEKWKDPEFAAACRERSAEQGRVLMGNPDHVAKMQVGGRAYWADPENRRRRSELMRSHHLANPETSRAALTAMRSGAEKHWANPEARAEQSEKTKVARASQTPERRKEIAALGVAARAKKRAEHEAYLATLSQEDANQVRAEARAKKSAETMAGRAAATPEQKAASKERYRQAALRRTPEQREKLRLARIAAKAKRLINAST
jgi:hypothetical protein